MSPVRDAIQNQVRHLMGAPPSNGASPLDTGDAGLFGPDAACWKVHGDFTSMMIGGGTALLLQMLHPGPLAGVWDHSNFRQDMQGRLRRTAQFIALTTYGSTEQAHGVIDRVKMIHGQVTGTLPDGTPYAADDPDLLTFVHVAEVSSFLAAYLRYRDPNFPGSEQDRYYAETARVAEMLGATQVPKSRREVADYLRAIRPQLRYDARTREVAQALLTQPIPNPAIAPFAELMFKAARHLLPDWAARMHGFATPLSQRPGIWIGVQGMGTVLRWAFDNSAETRARRRVASLSAS